MLKARLFGLAIACVVAIIGVSPVTAFAAVTDTETSILFEKDKDHKGNRALLEEKMNIAIKKWNELTVAQKGTVYDLLENELKAQFKMLDRIVELGVIEKDDAMLMKAERMARFGKLRESGEFPLLRQKGNKRNK